VSGSTISGGCCLAARWPCGLLGAVRAIPKDRTWDQVSQIAARLKSRPWPITARQAEHARAALVGAFAATCTALAQNQRSEARIPQFESQFPLLSNLAHSLIPLPGMVPESIP